MAVNLSFPRANEVGRFYTPIHRTIEQRAATALPPTSAEFKRWLECHVDAAGRRGVALDAGCGAHALNSRVLAGLGFTVVAIDVSADAAQAARCAGLRAARASVMQLPFDDGRFDLVVCTGVAHHTPAPYAALQELHRVVRRDGLAYVSLYTFQHSPFEWAVRGLRLAARVVPFRVACRIGRVSRAVNNFVLDHMYVPLLWLFTAAELQDAFGRVGFEILENFVSAMDPFHPGRTRVLSGDGLLRVFVLRKR